MPRAHHGEIEIEWESRGPSGGEVILLIMGLGAQMTAWRDGFCDLLAGAGYRVLRFDNRDSGLSSYTSGTPPTFRDLAGVVVRGRAHPAMRYSLSDMSDDALAVLDDAGVERAHVVGASLGGMIAQTLAIEHPERAISLTSIMSRTGARLNGLPTPSVLRKVMQPTPADPVAALTYELERAEVIAGPLFDRAAMAEFLTASRARAAERGASTFQLAAVLGSGDRTAALRRLDVPTLVIHGRADRLVGLSGGHATARAVPGAELIVHDEMGHDLPRQLWGSLTDAIVAHAREAARVRLAV